MSRDGSLSAIQQVAKGTRNKSLAWENTKDSNLILTFGKHFFIY